MTDAIAIDFGTTRTKLAYLDPHAGKPQLMHFHHNDPYVPSLFYLERGSESILWGHDAEAMQESSPEGIVDVLKRQLREPFLRRNRRKVTPGELLSLLLRCLRDQAGQEVAVFAGEPPSAVSLTIPALYGPPDERVLREAAIAAGFDPEQIELVPEPVAAARAWLAETKANGQEVVVLDCGGGTIDWAYLRREGNDFRIVPECPPGGDRHVGGHDVDVELLNRVKDALEGEADVEIEQTRFHYLQQVRALKERYCRGLPVSPLKVGGQSVALQGPEIQAVLESRFIRQAAESLKGYLSKVKAGPVTGTPTVLLVGGSARIKGLKEAIEKECGCSAVWWERSEYATVLGAVAGAAIPPRPDPAIEQYRAAVEMAWVNQWLDRAEVERLITLASELKLKREQAAAIEQQVMGDFKEVILDRQKPVGDKGDSLADLERRAKRGDVQAQCQLAAKYESGTGVEKDPVEAVRWYRRAAEQGHPDAQFEMGERYENGANVPQDHAEAARWYRKAAEQGHAPAEAEVGAMYYKGWGGVAQDHAEAARWLRKAAEHGYAAGQAVLGSLYLSGRGVVQDHAEAARWLRKAAEQGNVMAQNLLGTMYQAGAGMEQDPDEALRWFRKAAKEGNADAQYNLGSMYCDGKDVAQNYNKALRWFRSAAGQGHARAQMFIASMYLNGLGVAQDDAEAARWLRKAAEQGHAEAQTLLGSMYRYGRGVAQSYDEAIAWYRKAAEQGEADAQNALGFLYFSGEGLAKNHAEALRWLKRAAEQGHAGAQFNLGFMYSYCEGMSRDDKVASIWFQKAGEHDNARSWLAALQLHLMNGQWEEADAATQYILRLKSGHQRIDSQQAASAIPSDILYMLDHWWRTLGPGPLAGRKWVFVSGFTDYTGFFSVTTFLQARLKELSL